MRTIKFRGWDLDNKVWLSPFRFNIRMNDGSMQLNGDNEIIGNIELMQFTGLLDSNGKEIYEEDIVKFWGGIGIIIYFEPYASFRIEYKKNDVFDINDGMDIEIIGNKFENPELLK